MLQVVENVDVDTVVGAALFEQFAERVLDIVVVGELQNRLLHHSAEPYDGLADELRGPLAGAYEPRCLLAGELLCGILVHDHLDVGVRLQVGCRNLARNLALDDLLHDVRLVLAPGHQDDALGPHDRSDAHRNSHLRGVLHAVEGSRLHLEGVVRKLHETRARTGVRTRLVEADLSVLADADNHQIDLAGGTVVGIAILRNLVLGDRSVGNVDVLGLDVDVVEELLVDAVVAALLLVRADRVELVETEYGHVAEADLPGLVASYQLVVEAQGRTSGGDAQHERLRAGVCGDRADDRIGDMLHGRVLALVYARTDFLVAMENVARGQILDQTAVLRK